MKTLSLVVLLTAGLMLLPGAATAEPEQTPPAPSADGPKAPDDRAAAAEPTESPRVVVFQTSWCPYCRMLTRHLDQRGVAYRTVDVEKDAAAREELAAAFRWNGGIPVVRVDKVFVLGFDPAAVDAELVKAGLYDPE